MSPKYIMPVIGQAYANRDGKMYRCIGNTAYPNNDVMQKTVELGDHLSTMICLSDGWTSKARGVFQYTDGSIQWRYAANGCFAAESLAYSWKICGPTMYQYFEFLDDLRDSGEVNMFFAVSSLQREFLELGRDRGKANAVLQAWKDSYKDCCEGIED